jgi:RNA recognition motif-containing protein
MNTKLYVGNIPYSITAEDLRILFSEAGSVVSVKLVTDPATGKSKGFAFVEMISRGDAGKAVSEFNGYKLANRQIKVMPARNGKQTSNQKGGYNPAGTAWGGYTEYKSYNESIRPNYLHSQRENSR